MKLFIMLLLSTSTSTSIWATALSLVGPCFEEPVIKEELEVNSGESVGAYSVRFLEKFGIEYIGAERGMNSILGTPTGMDAMEIISDREMNAYGWCYSVNGFSPEVYPDEYEVKQGDEVKWWFGYAHYFEGQWLTQCSPSYERKPEFLCKE